MNTLWQVKIHSCSKAINTEHRAKLCNLSPAMASSQAMIRRPINIPIQIWERIVLFDRGRFSTVRQWWHLYMNDYFSLFLSAFSLSISFSSSPPYNSFSSPPYFLIFYPFSRYPSLSYFFRYFLRLLLTIILSLTLSLSFSLSAFSLSISFSPSLQMFSWFIKFFICI